MEPLYRFVSGAAAGAAALFAPVGPLAVCAAVFIGADFVVGVLADRAVARRAGRQWFFESRKAWRTVRKLALTIAAIALAWLIDGCIRGAAAPELSRAFAGFACGVELWSFLENAAQLSDLKLFRLLGRYVRRRIGEEADDA